MTRDRPVPVTMGSPQAKTVSLRTCRLNVVRFPSRLRLAVHIHEPVIVAVTLEGAFDVSFRSHTLTTGRGVMHVEPATERHGNTFAEAGARVVALEIDPAKHGELFEPCRALFEAPLALATPGAELAARRLAREAESPDDLSGLAMEGLVLDMLVSASRAFAVRNARMAPPRWLVRAREMVDGLFHQALAVSDLAREAGVHPMHLSRAFQAYFGLPPASYQRHVRLNWALERLANSEEPIATIASRAGYADQSHLTRAVKRSTGHTPARFRHARRVTRPRPITDEPGYSPG